jgi:glycosyltransferase involved in cell wall biosynthesis
MSCKKPILLAIDGVSRQLVEDAKCGYYVEPENTDEIVLTVRKIINEPEHLIELGLNGYNFAKQYFDRNILANDYLKKIIAIIK